MNDKYIENNEENLPNVLFLQKYLDILPNNSMIAGGCYKNIFNHEDIKDIDIFFKSKTDFEEACKKLKNANFKKSYENDNVMAFKDEENNVIIELIKKEFYNTPKELLDKFDFTITKFCYWQEENENSPDIQHKILHHNKFFEHLLTKKLVLEDNDIIYYPFSTFERALRYTKYGYNLCKYSKINLINAMRDEETFDEEDLSMSLYYGLD